MFRNKLFLFTLVGVAVLAIFLGNYSFQKKNAEVVKESEKNFVKVSNDVENKNFYEKINDKENLKFLIIGDSIGQSSGTGDTEFFWYNQLNKKIKNAYGIDHIETRRITAGGATTFDGVVNYFSSNLVSFYDLIFISFGQNDQAVMEPNEYGMFYENIMIRLKLNHPEAEIVTLIESSIEDENYSNLVSDLAKRHNSILIDTRIPFEKSGKSKEELTVDSIHPTNEGYTMYADQMFAEISKRISENKNPAKINELLFEDKEIVDIKTVRDFTMSEGFEMYTFGERNYLKSDKTGEFLQHEFEGTLVGFTLLGTDDSGIINVYIDGELVREINPYTAEPREKQIFVADGLSDGPHILKLEVSGRLGFDYKGKPTKGTNAIISQIITNMN